MKEKKGKILKVRRGYNANSSSISTVVTYFLWGSTAVVATVNTISAVVLAGKGKNGGPAADGKNGEIKKGDAENVGIKNGGIKNGEIRNGEMKNREVKNGGKGSGDEKIGKDD